MKNYLLLYFLCFSLCGYAQTSFLPQPKSAEQCQTKAEIAAENIEISILKQKYYSTHKAAYDKLCCAAHAGPAVFFQIAAYISCPFFV